MAMLAVFRYFHMAPTELRGSYLDVRPAPLMLETVAVYVQTSLLTVTRVCSDVYADHYFRIFAFTA